MSDYEELVRLLRFLAENPGEEVRTPVTGLVEAADAIQSLLERVRELESKLTSKAFDEHWEVQREARNQALEEAEKELRNLWFEIGDRVYLGDVIHTIRSLKEKR